MNAAKHDPSQDQTEQQRAQHDRNAMVQGATDEHVNLGAIGEKIKAEYDKIDQPGLHPANRPSGSVEGERDPHKSTRDLEDVTGNPGHRGVNPNAPATSINPAPSPEGDMLSINEPPGSNVMPPVETQPQQGQPGQLPKPDDDGEEDEEDEHGRKTGRKKPRTQHKR
jgi:hypothetical protein